jgi:hypothetical protein
MAIAVGFLSSNGRSFPLAGTEVADEELILTASHALEWDNFWHGKAADCRLSGASHSVPAIAIVGAASASLVIPILRCTITLELTSDGLQPIVISPWRTSDDLSVVVREENSCNKVADTAQIRELRVPV